MPPKPKPKPGSSYFEPGSAVEVKFDDEGFRGSWFSATVIRRLSSGRFLVECDNLIADERSSNPLREALSPHQLRPRPPPETHREFKIGDKVDAFHNDGWWKGHVTKNLGTGRFGVYFRVSKEHMVFQKEQLRIHSEWINHNWVPPITDMVKGKESMGVMTRKRQRERESESDRLSEFPDSVLLHIMNFMDTKSAVRTCVLSKRWRDVSKSLTNLAFHSLQKKKRKFDGSTKFMSWVLSNRDYSCSLLNLDFKNNHLIDPEILNSVMKYAVSHNVQNLTIDTNLVLKPCVLYDPLVFSCQSLTSLKLSIRYYHPWTAIFPRSLQMPALKSLYLARINFIVGDNDCAEPFSSCHVLNDLVLKNCYFPYVSKVFCIYNSSLSSFTVSNDFHQQNYKIVFSTPNLSSFTIRGYSKYQLSFPCNLSFLEEVSIEIFHKTSSIIKTWLQVFHGMKIMTLSSSALKLLLADLTNSGSTITPPPCFGRLEALKVKMQWPDMISDEEINRAVKYLLQNSPMARIDIIKNESDVPNIVTL